MNSNPEQLKELKKLEILLHQSKGALFGGVIVAVLALPLCWNWGNHFLSLAWITFYCTISFLRYRLTLTTFQSTPEMQVMNRIRRRYTILTLLSGISWGLISIYFLSVNLDFGSVMVILAVSLTAPKVMATGTNRSETRNQ